MFKTISAKMKESKSLKDLVLYGFAILLALYLFPFTIGGILIYAIWKIVKLRWLRASSIIVVLIPTLFFGLVWVNVMFGGSTNKQTGTPQSVPVVSRVGGVTLESTPSVKDKGSENTEDKPPAQQGVPQQAESKKEELANIGSEIYLVTRVVDGDTIEIEGGQKVRYIGIDTPESVHPSKPVECFAIEASNKNKKLVLGKRVRLEKDVSETDKYGRLLRYVWVGDVFVNDFLVRQGYAYSYSYPPDVKYQDQFKQAEGEARGTGRGLWAVDACKSSAPPASTPNTRTSQDGGSGSESSGSGFTCNCSKLCSQMASCEEAYFQLNTCGCSRRDGNKDGIPCESICR